MRFQFLISAAALAAVFVAAACEQNVAGLPARDHSGDATQVAALDTAPADPRDAPVPDFNGHPMWSANRDNTAEQNAQAAFERNGEALGATSFEDFLTKVHAFTSHPPAGAQTLTRANNGDRLIYDAKANLFAVVTKDGAPRTMFKPDNGAAYWEEQKTRESQRASGGAAKNQS